VRLTEEAAGRHDHEATIRHAQRIIDLEPTDEAAVRIQMEAHLALGDRTAALRSYHRYTEVLERDLWRIAVESLNHSEQHVWAALAGGWLAARAPANGRRERLSIVAAPAGSGEVVGRGSSFGVSALFALTVFAGCLGSGEEPKVLAEVAVLPDVSLVGTLPPGEVALAGDVIQVTWKGPLDAPKGLRVTIPEGITRVDAVYTHASPATTGSIAMYSFPSGRIRCQPDGTKAFFTPFTGRGQCSGVTGLDPFPATWRVPFASLLDGASAAST
jgi:hypothetical protein